MTISREKQTANKICDKWSTDSEFQWKMKTWNSFRNDSFTANLKSSISLYCEELWKTSRRLDHEYLIKSIWKLKNNVQAHEYLQFTIQSTQIKKAKIYLNCVTENTKLLSSEIRVSY